MPLQRIPGAMVSDSTITGADVQDGSINTADLADNAVTRAKVGESMICLGTQQATTSGVFKEFTGIPSWVKRVTVMLNNVSLNGSSDVLVQMGAGSITSTGYVSGSAVTSNIGRTSTSGFLVISGTAGFGVYAHVCLTNVSGNTWLSSHQGFLAGSSTLSFAGGGSVPLSGTLDRIRITTVNGTDTFDAGAVNISWE